MLRDGRARTGPVVIVWMAVLPSSRSGVGAHILLGGGTIGCRSRWTQPGFHHDEPVAPVLDPFEGFGKVAELPSIEANQVQARWASSSFCRSLLS